MDLPSRSRAMSDLDRLIRFAVVAEELSFTKAARRLGVDQPWLSRQIQQLENQLGFLLFVRNTRQVALTSEGERLLGYAANLAKVAEHTREAVRNLSRSHRSVITLGVNPNTFWLPGRTALLNRFEDRYGHSKVDIVSHFTPRLLSKLRKGLLDAVIVPAPEVLPDLDWLMIHRSSPSLLVPPEDPLAGRKSVAVEELAGRRIATTDPSLYPVVYRHKYGPIFDAGAEPVIVQEGPAAISFYAKTQRLIIIALSWPESDVIPPEGFVHVPISPPSHHVQFALVRRREESRMLLNQFWKVAQDVSDEVLGRSAAATLPSR
jgi:DNA-binding transcriptional LysR family regulator